MKILITGVTSFLGQATARALMAAGHQVMGAVRPSSSHIEELKTGELAGLQQIPLDFDELPRPDRKRYRELFSVGEGEAAGDAAGNTERAAEAVAADVSAPALIDVWIHYSWDGIGSAGRQDREIQKRNVENGKKAYYMAEALGVRRFIFAGSQAEYGTGDHEKPMPVSEYGREKRDFGNWGRTQSFQERGLWRRSGKQGPKPMEFLHLRIYSVYGPGDHPGTLCMSLLDACRQGTALSLGPCTQSWNYLEIRDFQQAIRLLVESEQADTGIYDVASEDTRPLRDYVLEGAAVLMEAELEARTRETAMELSGRTEFSARVEHAEQREQTMAPSVTELSEVTDIVTGAVGVAQPQQEISTGAGIAPSADQQLQGFCLHFGVRENNAEGDSGMHPDLTPLRRLGFTQEISFREGMLELRRRNF